MSLTESLWQPAPALTQAEAEDCFVFIVPAGFETDFIGFWTRYGEDLEASFDFFPKIYGVTPPLPIYVRVVVSREEILELNILVPPCPTMPPIPIWARARLPSSRRNQPHFYTTDLGLSATRLELYRVFLSTLAENNLPGGLELGLSQYIALSGPAQAACRRCLRRRPSAAPGYAHPGERSLLCA